MTPELQRALDELVDRERADRRDWSDVVRRPDRLSAAAPDPLFRRRRLLVLVAAISSLLAAAAFATALDDRFSSWVSGSPGTPAPASDQRGFAERNRVAFASFPEGTKLRLLLSRTVGGTTFNLLGFRNGDAYCLRLARADSPNAIGRNACLRAAELRGRAALVAGDALFRVGDPEWTSRAIFGFASDDVAAVLVRRTRGRERVPVENNVFLGASSQAARTVRRRPLADRVLALTALLRDGGRRNIPYVVEGVGVFRGGRIPSGPTYFGRDPNAKLPGPTRVEAPIRDPSVGWLDRREPRGTPLTPLRGGVRVEFGRFIQPDPDSPVRVGVLRASSLPLGGRLPRRQPEAICIVTSPPLALEAGSYGCSPVFSEGALILGPWGGDPIVDFAGVAADGITRVTAFLATGRTVEAALRDNVFSVAVPQADLGMRLVGYDGEGRVAAITAVHGNAVALPCPRAALPTPIDQLPPPRPWERIDLGAMTVAGAEILGRTPAEVVAVLGEPTRTIRAAQRTNGVPIPELRYGGALAADAGLTIRFVKKRDRIEANSLSFRSPSVVDARLGHVLRMQPERLQRDLGSTYGGSYRPHRSYGADPLSGCTGSFLDRRSPAGIAFGLDPHRPSRPSITILRNGASA